jgi:RimJ/RimL family protein N-acetyltransferase
MGKEIAKYHKKNEKILPVLIGEKVSLKPILNDEFYEKYNEWLNHEEVIKGVGEEGMTNEEIVQMHSEDPANLTLAIYNNETGKPIGDINLFDSEEFKKGPEIAIMLGERGKGFGTEAMKLMMEYGFNTIKVSQINLTVYKDNPAARLYPKIGFEIVGEKQDSETGKDEYEMSLKKAIWKKMNKTRSQ